MKQGLRPERQCVRIEARDAHRLRELQLDGPQLQIDSARGLPLHLDG
jgi:hypothetical protein